MPCVEKRKSNGQVSRIYFEKESERYKYEDFNPPFVNISGIFQERIGRANVRQGDKEAMMYYKAMDRAGIWKGEHTKEQIKKIYKDVL